MRRFNFYRHYKRVCVQILLENFSRGDFAVTLTPHIEVGSNHVCAFAIGIRWLFGSINLGVLTADYLRDSTNAANRKWQEDSKLGLNKLQSRLRDNGY